MQNIYVITHAQSLHHTQGRVGGWYDTGLTELGRAQAALAAERLKSQIANTRLHLVSSDLKRAAETAEIIAAAIAAPVILDKGFRENCYGIAEGKPQAWLDKRIIPAPNDDRLDHKVISGAESKREFVSRIYDSMSKLPKDRDVVIVTHGFALTFVIASWVGLPLEQSGFVNFTATPGGITHLKEDDFFKNKGVKFVNSTSHLSP